MYLLNRYCKADQLLAYKAPSYFYIRNELTLFTKKKIKKNRASNAIHVLYFRSVAYWAKVTWLSIHLTKSRVVSTVYK